MITTNYYYAFGDTALGSIFALSRVGLNESKKHEEVFLSLTKYKAFELNLKSVDLTPANISAPFQLSFLFLS